MRDAVEHVTGQAEPAPAGRSGLARACGGAGFAVWAVGASGLVAYLMALHAVPLPPAAGAPVHPTLAVMQTGRKVWRAIHVLAEGCPCSAAVADDLVSRGPAGELDETVYVAGGDGNDLERRLTGRGFRVRRVTSDLLLSGFAIRGAPWLVVVDPDGRVAYSGGYAAERPGAGVELQDLSIIRQLRAGQRVAPLPAFGCAIDPALRRAMDPLGLR